MLKIVLSFVLLLSFTFSGCQHNQEKDKPEKKIEFPKSMKEATFNNVQNRWSDEDAKIIYAEQIFYSKNRSEILKNFEIVDSLSFENIGLVLIRFSIGTNIYRKGIWLRKVDDYWGQLTYFSKYSDEYKKSLDDTKKLFDKMFEKNDEWEKESKYSWFW